MPTLSLTICRRGWSTVCGQAGSSAELVVYSLATQVQAEPVGCPDRPSSVGLTRTIEPYWREMRWAQAQVCLPRSYDGGVTVTVEQVGLPPGSRRDFHHASCSYRHVDGP